jgi:hypothetical protein
MILLLTIEGRGYNLLHNLLTHRFNRVILTNHVSSNHPIDEESIINMITNAIIIIFAGPFDPIIEFQCISCPTSTWVRMNQIITCCEC